MKSGRSDERAHKIAGYRSRLEMTASLPDSGGLFTSRGIESPPPPATSCVRAVSLVVSRAGGDSLLTNSVSSAGAVTAGANGMRRSSPSRGSCRPSSCQGGRSFGSTACGSASNFTSESSDTLAVSCANWWSRSCSRQRIRTRHSMDTALWHRADSTMASDERQDRPELVRHNGPSASTVTFCTRPCHKG